MVKIVCVSLLVFACASSSHSEGAASNAPDAGEPFRNLTTDQLAAFNDGKGDFTSVETPETGLGPIFNEASCVACHLGPGSAVGGSNDRLVTRFGKTANGVFDPLTSLGGTLQQDHAIGGPCAFGAEAVPAQANVVAHRRTVSLYGLGLVDALTPDSIETLAFQEQRNNPSTAGKVSIALDIGSGQTVVAKFGWKAQETSLLQFAGDAYLNEMGMTNPLFPDESCPQGDCSLLSCNPAPGMNEDAEDLAALANFMGGLAPPAPLAQGTTEQQGIQVAQSIGCFQCHTQTLTAGPSAMADINNATFHPYSDFLLHDMGALGDGIVQGSAGPTQMRTAPLWGLRYEATFLHDGRAASVDQAIRGHDGQGGAASASYAALPQQQRDALLAFLKTL
ncbi:MAG TPA: di-heme oxidoredictase family protein [Myxococcales bacterium]|jgi:CxxC motif-containing protein (DUF1111 family)|nr:di-heme oxidoredictase family protein [Myxococcales bacterium]